MRTCGGAGERDDGTWAVARAGARFFFGAHRAPDAKDFPKTSHIVCANLFTDIH